ncbi:MAG: hypothetical protein WBE37_05100 [Bryobacteraceae bacterium]
MRSIFGVYGQPTAGHDSIRIAKAANRQIAVNIKLYYANGHTCQLTADGQWMRDHIGIVAQGLDANHPCRLNLFFEDHRVRLRDEGLQCAPVYCGTRGKLDDASLPKLGADRK